MATMYRSPNSAAMLVILGLFSTAGLCVEEHIPELVTDRLGSPQLTGAIRDPRTLTLRRGGVGTDELIRCGGDELGGSHRRRN